MIKLAFVEGKFIVPKDGSKDYEMWRQCTSMVTSWILNSISKDLVESFLYITNARELLFELGERYGESYRMMIYQIKRRIASISQENLFVTTYYSILKQLWDELANIVPIPPYSCGSEKLATEIHNADHQM
uniref:Retrotransposon Copia-like N-terminal domain-containing protein n=1 Tax=Manihot esculenta TaxID=3983 RepID=A0A2C9UQ98_MANES